MEGHGRIADLDRSLSWEQMTDDVAAAVKKLGFDQVDVMGYSLDGVMALRMGVKYPSLVRKLVVVSGLYSPAGYYPANRPESNGDADGKGIRPARAEPVPVAHLCWQDGSGPQRLQRLA